MSGKRGLVCLISVAFIAVAVFVFFYAFTIKSVEVEFTAIYGSNNYKKVQQELDSIFCSTSLVFRVRRLEPLIESNSC